MDPALVTLCVTIRASEILARVIRAAIVGLDARKARATSGVGTPQTRRRVRLSDRQRPGRPRELDHRAIVTETLKPPFKKLGVTHWSTRLLAERLRVSNTTIARAWRSYGIKPWKAESFRFSTDPELVGKVTDICGLYLAPPEIAIVLCVDEPHRADSAMQEKRIER